MADIIQIRRDTIANWTSVNPVLSNGEMGFETDTKKLRIGDGVTQFLSLTAGGLSTWGNIEGTLSDQIDLQEALDLKSNTTHTHAYEPADATILKDADIGVSVEAYVTKLTAWNTNFGLLHTQVAYGDHVHTGVYEPVDATILRDADIGVTVQAYDATVYIAATEKAAANGVATLGADSKIPAAQLPAIAISETFVVASEVAQLALTVQQGDVAVRTDLSASYIALNDNNATMADWQILLTPTDAVVSVNSQTGAVVLGYADVGAEPADATILKDADIGVNVQAYDATILVDADIGVSVQAYDANTALTSDITYETLNTNGDVGTAAGTLAIGNHTHVFAAVAPNASSRINTPVHMPTIDEFISHMWSATVTDGAVITDNANGTISVSETHLTIRGGSEHTQLYTARIAETLNIPLTDNATNVVYADWNSGSPQIAVTLNPNEVDILTKVPMYVIVREGNNIIIVGSLEEGVDANAKLRKRFFFTEKWKRVDGGSVISESGTRNLFCTAGSFYFGLREITHSAIDTSVTGSFEFYRLIAGAWVESDETQLDNLQYNDISTPGSEVLTALATNKYAVHWVYVIPNDVSTHYHVVYSQDTYNNLSSAQAATQPSSLPPSIAGLGQLLGRYTIQESGTAGIMETVWTVSFDAATATTHNGLAGLQGGTVNEYYHLTAAEHTAHLAHVLDATKHRLINDAGTSTTELFSASKIIAGNEAVSAAAEDLSIAYAIALGG